MTERRHIHPFLLSMSVWADLNQATAPTTARLRLRLWAKASAAHSSQPRISNAIPPSAQPSPLPLAPHPTDTYSARATMLPSLLRRSTGPRRLLLLGYASGSSISSSRSSSLRAAAILFLPRTAHAPSLDGGLAGNGTCAAWSSPRCDAQSLLDPQIRSASKTMLHILLYAYVLLQACWAALGAWPPPPPPLHQQQPTEQEGSGAAAVGVRRLRTHHHPHQHQQQRQGSPQ